MKTEGISKHINLSVRLSQNYKQNITTKGCSKFKRFIDMTSSGMNDLNIRANGTGLGVRRSKRPLLASRTRCNYSMETSRN